MEIKMTTLFQEIDWPLDESGITHGLRMEINQISYHMYGDPDKLKIVEQAMKKGLAWLKAQLKDQAEYQKLQAQQKALEKEQEQEALREQAKEAVKQAEEALESIMEIYKDHLPTEAVKTPIQAPDSKEEEPESASSSKASS